MGTQAVGTQALHSLGPLSSGISNKLADAEPPDWQGGWSRPGRLKRLHPHEGRENCTELGERGVREVAPAWMSPRSSMETTEPPVLLEPWERLHGVQWAPLRASDKGGLSECPLRVHGLCLP